MVEGNNPFQVAWLPDEERDHYLDKINALQDVVSPQSQIVFEGNAPADAEHCQALQHFLLHPPAAPLKHFSAWLGEPIAIKEATMAQFRRQSGSNLAIVGQDDEAAKGMIATSLLTLAAQHRKESAVFQLIDFSSADDQHVRMAIFSTCWWKACRRRRITENVGILLELSTFLPRK